jgi:hypothetical protein
VDYLMVDDVEIKLRRVFIGLIVPVAFLSVMDFFPGSLNETIDNRFNLDGEANIPAWYSTVLLFSVSLSAFVIYLSGGLPSDRPSRRKRAFWLGFSIVYCFFSLDEAARLHEIIDKTTSIKWVYVYAPFALVFLAVCVFHLATPCNHGAVRRWILGGLGLSCMGAMGFELLGYLMSPLPRFLQHLEFVFEEGSEMTGTAMVLVGCLYALRHALRSSLQEGSLERRLEGERRGEKRGRRYEGRTKGLINNLT